MSFRRLAPVLLALAASTSACRSGTSGDDRATSASVRRYTIRGEVMRLPDSAAKGRQLSLRHEAIPGFVNEAGAVVGMDSMVMPFDLASDVALEGVRVGDKVEALLAVDWSRPSLRIERLQKLPGDTALVFGKARPGVQP